MLLTQEIDYLNMEDSPTLSGVEVPKGTLRHHSVYSHLIKSTVLRHMDAILKDIQI